MSTTFEDVSRSECDGCAIAQFGVGNLLQLRLPTILFIGLRQDHLRSSVEVDAITAVRLDEFLIMVRVSGSLFCEILVGVDTGTAISRLIGLRFSLALAAPLARNCIP